MSKKIQLGFIGCGGIATSHLHGLCKKSDVNLAAFCDLDIKRAKIFAEKYGNKKTVFFDKSEKMLKNVVLDAVFICLPPFAHGVEFEVIDQSLPFFVEKPEAEAYLIDCPELYLKPVSATFHGRDIMAPVAASLACGVSPQELGNKVINANLKKLELPQLQIDPKRGNVTGLVCQVDHFGNLTTNIHEQDVVQLGVRPDELIIEVAGRQIKGLTKTYGETAPNALTALYGSRQYLEIASNQASAADMLQAKVGDAVSVRTHRAT